MAEQNTWVPRNKKQTAEETPFKFYGCVKGNNKSVLVYGDKPEADENNPKPREPQSSRKLNVDTFAKMIRGEFKLGELGVDALAPLPGDRESVDLGSFLDDDCPYREDFVKAYALVRAEVKDIESIELPEWATEEMASE